jgi:hypothetical protein
MMVLKHKNAAIWALAALALGVVQINQWYPQAGLFVIIAMIVIGLCMGVIKVFL